MASSWGAHLTRRHGHLQTLLSLWPSVSKYVVFQRGEQHVESGAVDQHRHGMRVVVVDAIVARNCNVQICNVMTEMHNIK